jgi:hypothetical protein
MCGLGDGAADMLQAIVLILPKTLVETFGPERLYNRVERLYNRVE